MDGVNTVVRDERKNGNVCSRPRRVNGVYTRCWSRDFATCPSCAGLNALYTKKLLGAGMEDENCRYFFMTLTAPSFGKIHLVPHSDSDRLRTCGCGVVHEYGSALAGVPLDASRYLYRDAVSWNHASSELFRRTMKYLGDALPELSWAAVREYQKRGSLHLHVIVRLPRSVDPVEAVDVLQRAYTYKTRHASWGRSSDVRLLTDDDGATVRYLSKVIGYAVKTLGKSVVGLSSEQKSFYKKLDAASMRLDYSRKVVSGFGYGGQLFTKSANWSDLTKADLLEAARGYAAENSLDDTPRRIASVDVNAEELRVVASEFGSAEDYVPSSTYADSVRQRLPKVVSFIESPELHVVEMIDDEMLDRLLELDDLDI